MSLLHLYHTGFEVIQRPDLAIGRRNADFGQGFYLCDSMGFSRRWARERKGMATYLNEYELDTEGLAIRHLSRDSEWFDYISMNRAGRLDALAEFDVITGPIANDTLYDTWGIITSGLLKPCQALRLLMIGPTYQQTVIKTEKAAAALCFLGAVEISAEEIAEYREAVRLEEQRYQQELAVLLENMEGFAENYSDPASGSIP